MTRSAKHFSNAIRPSLSGSRWLSLAGLALIAGISPWSDSRGDQNGSPKPSTPMTIKRLHQQTAEELRKELQQVPETGLDAVPNTAANLVTFAARQRENGGAYLGPAHLIGERIDLACLPLQAGLEAVLSKEPAEDLQAMSRKLRRAIEDSIPKGTGDPRPDPEVLRKKLLAKDG